MFSRSKEVREFARKIITAFNIIIAMCGLSNCLRILIKMIYPCLRVFFGELLHTGNRCTYPFQPRNVCRDAHTQASDTEQNRNSIETEQNPLCLRSEQANQRQEEGETREKRGGRKKRREVENEAAKNSTSWKRCSAFTRAHTAAAPPHSYSSPNL